MSDKVNAWMPWFFGDYLKDTGDLTLEEHGAYLLLLGHMWSRGGTLPADRDRLARIMGADRPTVDRVWVGIGRFFVDSGDGLLTQKRLVAELGRAQAQKTAAVENGRKGGLAKQANAKQNPSDPSSENLATLVANGVAKGVAKSSSSPSPSPSPSDPPSPQPPPSPKGDTRALARTRPSEAVSQEPQNLHAKLLASFCALWQNRYGESYAPSGAERSQLGRILQALTPEQASALPGCFERYLEDDEEFVAGKMRHSLLHFCTQGGVNKYRVAARGSGLSEREKRGARNAQVWLDMHGVREGGGSETHGDR